MLGCGIGGMGGPGAGMWVGTMRAVVSWEDEAGNTHRWELVYDEDDAEARHFLEALQLHVRFKLESFDTDPATPD
jgi:hypothetical protein